MPWEVDEFWAKFKSDVLPKVKAGSQGRSRGAPERVARDPPGLVEQARAQLAAAGAADPKVRVLSAYKQGYLWMTEQVIPELKGKNARAVNVKVAEYHPDLSKKYKFYMVPSRWVHELYPVDEIFQRELGIAKDAFSLELVDNPKDIYTVEATDAAGKVVYTPTSRRRPSSVSISTSSPAGRASIVTTGWLSATVDGTVGDRRADRDRSRALLGSLPVEGAAAHLRQRDEGDRQPAAARQAAVPSRPRHRGVDERARFQDRHRRGAGLVARSAARGSLFRHARFLRRARPHDDAGAGWRRPARSFRSSIPIGRASRARCRCTTPATRRRSRRSRSPTRRRASSGRRASRASSRRSTPRAAVVSARSSRGRPRERARRCDVEPKDDREAGRAVDALDALARLHAAGLYRDALSFDHVDRVAVDRRPEGRRTRGASSSRTGAFAAVERAPTPSAAQARSLPGKPLVTWDHIISPDESEAIVGQLAAFPEVKAYKAGRSYRGRDISVLEITNPTPSELVSLAKLTALQADDLHHRPPARERSLVDEPHPAARRAARHRHDLQGRS